MLKIISSFITIMCLLALTGLAQTNERLRFFCSYGGGNRGTELCAIIQKESFASNLHAEKAVDMILKPLGLKRNFVLVSCPNIANAMAVTFDDDGVRYIFYDNAFVESIDQDAGTDWASVSILAHELGHHLSGHTTLRMHNPPTKEELQQRREQELEADQFSGFAMFKLGATLAQAQGAMMALRDVPDPEENYDHPKRWRRLEAIKTGYDDAKSQQPIENIDTRPSAEAFFSKAYDFYEQKKYQEAVDNYTVAIGLNPNYTDAYFNRGIAKDILQDHRGAIEDYNQVIRQDPNNAYAYVGRGTARYNAQGYQGAIEDYNQAIRLNPNNADAYYGRGTARYGLQDPRGAIEDYNQAIRLNPSYFSAYYNRGIARDILQDHRGAIEDYSQAIRLDSNNADAYYGRGSARDSLQDYRGAIEDYNQAIRLNPNYGDAYYGRGVTKFNLGDTDGACEDFRQSCGRGSSQGCEYSEQNCQSAIP